MRMLVELRVDPNDDRLEIVATWEDLAPLPARRWTEMKRFARYDGAAFRQESERLHALLMTGEPCLG